MKKNRELTKDDLFTMIDALIDLYLGIYGCDEGEVLQALSEATDLTLEELMEHFPSLAE